MRSIFPNLWPWDSESKTHRRQYQTANRNHTATVDDLEQTLCKSKVAKRSFQSTSQRLLRKSTKDWSSYAVVYWREMRQSRASFQTRSSQIRCKRKSRQLYQLRVWAADRCSFVLWLCCWPTWWTQLTSAKRNRCEQLQNWRISTDNNAMEFIFTGINVSWARIWLILGWKVVLVKGKQSRTRPSNSVKNRKLETVQNSLKVTTTARTKNCFKTPPI